MAKKKQLSDSQKIDALIEVLKANGISLPPELDDEPKPDEEPAE